MARSVLAKVLGNSERVNEAHCDDADAEDARAASVFSVPSRLMRVLRERPQRFARQLELWVEQLEAVTAKRSCELEHAGSVPVARVAKPRREFGSHLPRETHTISPHDVNCPDCGGELKHPSDDASEMFELEPVRFKVIRQVRPKLACASCDTIVQAPASSRPIGRGMAGPALLAHVLVGTSADHVRLYRQAEIYAREGVDLDRPKLARWVGSMRALLTPLTDVLGAHVFAADVVHAEAMPSANALRQFTACWEPPDLTDTIPRHLCAR